MAWIRWILISSIIVVVVAAIIAFAIILMKVYKIKKQIKNDKINLANELAQKTGEQKLLERKDFGQPIYELKDKLEKHIDHEIVEFCINSIIRNEFKNILMIGNVEPYEVIGISNKSDSQITVLKDQFNVNLYQTLLEKEQLIKHKLNIIENLSEDNNEYFDSILLLNNFDKFEYYFEKYQKYLKNKGMFIISNTKKNRKSSKLLISKIKNFHYKYDMLKWHKGFALIVKTIND